MQIIAQYPLTAHLISLKCLCQRVFRLFQRSSCGRLVRVKSKIMRQLFRRLIAAQAKQTGGELNHIAVSPAAKAVEIILVQLHAGVPVIVERTAAHPIPLHLHSVVFGSLRDGHVCLYKFVDTHVFSSLIFRTGFPCHFNVRRKRGHPEKSVSFARNKKAALKSCKNAKPQSGRCSQRYVDIIPVMEYNLYRIRKGHNKP